MGERMERSPVNKSDALNDDIPPNLFESTAGIGAVIKPQE